MAAQSWISISPDSHFSLANIPFGIISIPPSEVPHVAIAIGDFALDLALFACHDGFAGLPSIHLNLNVFAQPTLNDFAALGRQVHGQVRAYLKDVLSHQTAHSHVLKDNASLRDLALHRREAVRMHLPMQIGDYTDFYAGLNHAYNVGVLFRGPTNALQPNYTHLPVGYHGRASSVVVTGTPVRRPWGQSLQNPAADPKVPVFGPCQKLDFELELGAFVSRKNSLGEPVLPAQAEESIFGYVLMNDWSARDIQAWEYVPLGPFNSKNFATTISAWVVLADALEPFRAKGLPHKTKLSSYLVEARPDTAYDIALEVNLATSSGTSTTITQTNARNLLWSFPQMLAHHTITGCPMNVGDLLGSGTISGTEIGSQGSLLEQNSNGNTELSLSGDEKRFFLQDGDIVSITGWAGGDTCMRVGFGDCVGRIEPALELNI